MSIRFQLRREDRGAIFEFVCLLGIGAALAVGVVKFPVPTLGLVALGFILFFFARQRAGLPKLYIRALAVLLLGYAFLARGFAYLGIHPIYVGEIVMILGVIAILAYPSNLRLIRSSRIVWILLAYMIWGAVQTIPYLSQYGMVALRDAVIWGYGTFAILTAVFVLRLESFDRALKTYSRVVPWLLLWIPFALALSAFADVSVLRTPGAGVELIDVSAGDVAVHLGGIGSFMILGLIKIDRPELQNSPRPKEWIWWIVWLTGVFLALTFSRSAMLAVLSSLGVVLLLWRWRARWRIPVFLTLSFLFIVTISNVEISLGKGRSLTVEQVVENAKSIVGIRSEETLMATREWRLDWWNRIVDYTVFGPYFWTGKGFGINLAVADDKDVGGSPDRPLRSPHNGHITVLARTGVPGAFLWVLLQGSFGVAFLLAYFRACRLDRWTWARINLWILAFWTAFHVNTTFDVYLEGPDGGIWFWCLFGFGIAVLERQKRETSNFRQAESHKVIDNTLILGEH